MRGWGARGGGQNNSPPSQKKLPSKSPALSELKITIFPSSLWFLIFHIYNTFISLLEKSVPNIFNTSLFRYIQRIPQTATWTPFRNSIPSISYLIKFGFNPEKFNKNKKYQASVL